MSRRLTIIALVASGGVAHAQESTGEPPMPPEDPTTTTPPGDTTPPPPSDTTPPPSDTTPPPPSDTTPATSTGLPSAPADMGDQGISAMIGAAAGGRTTPGGLMIAGHYYYQLSDADWFDGGVSFTFGSSDPECFRDRMENVVCDHGLADGYAGSITVGVRRFLPAIASGEFWPYVTGGVGTSVVRFPPEDDTTGITFFLHAGAGMRVGITEAIAITAQAQLQLGVGQFSNGVGGEPQLGLNITAGAEFKL